VRYVPDGSLLVPRIGRQIFHVTASKGTGFELALYTTRDHDRISHRIGSGIETIHDADVVSLRSLRSQRRSMIDRAIIMLIDHRFWDSFWPSSSGKTLNRYIHCCTAMRSPQRPTARAV